MSTSTSKPEGERSVYRRLLSNLVPEEFVIPEELFKLLDDAICILQAELEFKKIFEATELAWTWGNEIHNETADNVAAEEDEKNEKIGDAALYLDSIYWEMNEAFMAVSERRNLAKEAMKTMAKCRKEIIEKISRQITEKTHENLTSVMAVFDYPLRPDIASMPNSLAYELIALRKEVYCEPAWSVEIALTSENSYERMIMAYRYQLSFGKHFADYYKSLQEK